MVSCQYDTLLCSETLVSVMHQVSELLVPGFSRPLVVPMAAYVRDGYGAFRQPKFECGCCEMMVFMVLWCETEPLFDRTLTEMTGFLIVY